MTDHGRGEGERIGIYDDVQANQTDKGGGFPTPGPGDRLISETTNATECAASQPVTGKRGQSSRRLPVAAPRLYRVLSA